MFRDILVVLGAKGVAASYALSFARHFEAEVTAVWPAQYSAFDAVAAAQTRDDLVVGEEQAEEGAARTLEFVEQAHHFRVKAHTIAANDFGRGEPRNLPHFARGFDLVVVEQPTPEQHAFAGGLIGSIVSGCGRPMLATPYIQKDPASFDIVVVAWDASASAARALCDAIPILKRSKSVEIVTVANGKADHGSPGGAEVVRHLARHGIHAAFRDIPGGIDAAEMLLSYVADSGAKMMVTGAYGHSRLAETLAGGATRTLLDSMTIPLLMSH
jgi:nucleotide-binding universal stress UspA family protein